MQGKELYIGIMSGTSLDGVDVVLCEVDAGSCRLLHSLEYPLPKKLKDEILSTINATTTIQEVGALHSRLGKLFADAVTALLEKFHIDPNAVTAIGLHGQTLWHEPNAVDAFSLQLGNGAIVATQTHITTVTDFRSMDVANGGEGAPFAPAFHHFLFGSAQQKRAVLNIGGMANLTILEDKTLGFDVGCGNVLLDYFIDAKRSKPYDKDGTFARSGRVDTALLENMLEDAYFKKLPPKSTGREYFNAAWLEKQLAKFPNIADADIQRTLLELTAKSVADELLRFNVAELIVCGGGAKNSFLLERIKILSNSQVVQSSHYEVDGDFLEAMLFAWLAYKRIHNQSVALKDITGTKKDSILGAIYEKN